MGNHAIFVDAGYLFKAGGLELAKAKVDQKDLVLDIAAVVGALRAVAAGHCPASRFLRIYWYDATLIPGIKSTEQTLIAMHDNVKLRLGVMNSEGRQKGVDSLIVTDLIELARSRIIDDAVLLSGDEDVRVGVVVAQNMGVRVHLLGIAPSTGNQAAALREEADTKTEWTAAVIGQFLSHKPSGPIAPEIAPGSVRPAVVQQDELLLAGAVDHYFHGLDGAVRAQIKAYMAIHAGVIPQEYDRVLLPTCRSALSRDLTPEEKRKMRKLFRHRMDQV